MTEFVAHALEADLHACRELYCCWCQEPYSIWYADNDLWNEVMRRHDGSERVPFACPRCFLLRAELVLPIARISRPQMTEEDP